MLEKLSIHYNDDKLLYRKKRIVPYKYNNGVIYLMFHVLISVNHIRNHMCHVYRSFVKFYRQRAFALIGSILENCA
uniref:Uncharacterized protein n=1 Tax=Onchocerca volvulus TaxID=6282 RepID=A0A8R1Y044_ONCVO